MHRKSNEHSYRITQTIFYTNHFKFNLFLFTKKAINPIRMNEIHKKKIPVAFQKFVFLHAENLCI